MFLAIDWNALWNKLSDWVLHTGIPAVIRLLIGLIVMFIVFKIINIIFNRLQKKLKKENADKTVSIILVKFLRKALKVVVFVLFLGFVGIDTASVGALIASAGVTIGLALQGGLSNIAGGIIILLMRPFRIDDYIKGQGEEGTVEDIKLLNGLREFVDGDNYNAMVLGFCYLSLLGDTSFDENEYYIIRCFYDARYDYAPRDWAQFKREWC